MSLAGSLQAAFYKDVRPHLGACSLAFTTSPHQTDIISSLDRVIRNDCGRPSGPHCYTSSRPSRSTCHPGLPTHRERTKYADQGLTRPSSWQRTLVFVTCYAPRVPLQRPVQIVWSTRLPLWLSCDDIRLDVVTGAPVSTVTRHGLTCFKTSAFRRP